MTYLLIKFHQRILKDNDWCTSIAVTSNFFGFNYRWTHSQIIIVKAKLKSFFILIEYKIKSNYVSRVYQPTLSVAVLLRLMFTDILMSFPFVKSLSPFHANGKPKKTAQLLAFSRYSAVKTQRRSRLKGTLTRSSRNTCFILWTAATSIFFSCVM